MGLLERANVATRLPAQDLDRARAFYSQKLGLEPIEEREGGLRYQCASGSLRAASRRPACASGDHTQMAFEVDDIESSSPSCASRGVVFEEVDVPGLRTVDGIADIDGNYPSKGRGERAAWFRDSEGNLIGSANPCADRLADRREARLAHDGPSAPTSTMEPPHRGRAATPTPGAAAVADLTSPRRLSSSRCGPIP